MANYSRCSLCDARVTDEELKLDKTGWAEFRPACKVCIRSIQPDKTDRLITNPIYSPLYVGETLNEDFEIDEEDNT